MMTLQPIQPEMPPFLAPIVDSLISLLLCLAGGVVLGSILGYIIRRAIDAAHGDSTLDTGQWATLAGVLALMLIVCGIFFGLGVSGFAAAVYAIGVVIGTASFARPWWLMR